MTISRLSPLTFRLSIGLMLGLLLFLRIAAQLNQEDSTDPRSPAPGTGVQEQPTWRVDPDAPRFAPGQLIVKWSDPSKAQAFLESIGGSIIGQFDLLPTYNVISLPESMSVEQATNSLRDNPIIAHVEPNWYVQPGACPFPNPPKLSTGEDWGMNNISFYNPGWAYDVDINAPEGWTNGGNWYCSSTFSPIIAILDTGVLMDHQDLISRKWTNWAELNGTNGVDEDGNGLVDDIYGANVATNNLNGTFTDDAGHGTSVAGLAAAEPAATGTNAPNKVGVAWRARIMPVKTGLYTTNWNTGDVAEGILYAVKNGANIINGSFYFYEDSQLMRDALVVARNRGILSSFCTGNHTNNIDTFRSYPATYRLDNVLSVLAVRPVADPDQISDFSDYGQIGAHLGAPGSYIYSTAAASTSSYAFSDGTSMSAPMVSGAIAVLMAKFPDENHLAIKNRLLRSVTPSTSLTLKSQSGGRLNLSAAVSSTSWAPINDDFTNATTIYLPAGNSRATIAANNFGATTESGEPSHAGVSSGASIWFKWTCPIAQVIHFSSSQSGIDTVIQAYTNKWTAVAGASNDNSGWCSCGRISFSATTNTPYYICVAGKDGAQGPINLTIGTSAFDADPSLVALASSLTFATSNQVTFTVTGKSNALFKAFISTNLFEPLNSWVPASSNIVLNSSGSGQFVDSTLSGVTSRFWGFTATNQTDYDQRSCNIIGFVKRTIPTGWSAHGNPFYTTNQTISSIIPSPPYATTVYKLNVASQAWDSNTYEYAWDDPNMLLGVGEGFLIESQTNWILTFKGEVETGLRTMSVSTNYSMVSSRVPLAGFVTTVLRFPAMATNRIQRYEGGTLVNYTNNGARWTPNEPKIELGEGFISIKAQAQNWHWNWLPWY